MWVCTGKTFAMYEHRRRFKDLSEVPAVAARREMRRHWKYNATDPCLPPPGLPAPTISNPMRAVNRRTRYGKRVAHLTVKMLARVDPIDAENVLCIADAIALC